MVRILRVAVLIAVAFIASTNGFAKAPCIESNQFRELKRILNVGDDETTKIPKKVDKVILSTIHLDATKFDEMDKGKIFGFVLDQDDKLRYLDKPLELKKTRLWVGKEIDDPFKKDFLIKAHGSFYYDEATKKYTLKTNSLIDLSADEAKKIKAEAEKLLGAKGAVADVDALTPAQHLKCADILAGSKTGKGFLLNSYTSNNAVFFSTIFASSLFGEGIASTPQGRDIATADWLAMNIGIGVGGSISKYMIVKNFSTVKRFPVSLATGFTLMQMNNQLYKVFDNGDVEPVEGGENATVDASSDEYMKKLARFNMGWFFLKSVPVGMITDTFIAKKLPRYLTNRCLAGKAISVFVSPKMVRIYERYASSILYYGAAKPLFVGKSKQAQPVVEEVSEGIAVKNDAIEKDDADSTSIPKHPDTQILPR